MSEDLALPFDVATINPKPEEEDMPTLTIGGSVRVPELTGRWSVWSQTSETPGGYFVIPADDTARAEGVKYAVIRAVLNRGAAEPTLSLVRTDPVRRS